MILVAQGEVEDGNLSPPRFGGSRPVQCYVHWDQEAWH